MKGTGNQTKGKPRDSAKERSTRKEAPTDQSNAELRSYHKKAAEVLVSLDKANLDPDDFYERLVLASFGPEGRVDKRRYWKLLRAANPEQHMEILADADSLHWRLVPRGSDRGEWLVFRSHYRSIDEGNARYKAVTDCLSCIGGRQWSS